ncbi:MAG: transcriptional repressor [Bacteroidales bacterium]|jgi:Fe2+ or Zn2+ uptake regulation protein|nr:transcriptional repressor [Bacteroidales bacterium]
MTLEEFRTQLRRHKLKATRQRLAVHEVMMELGHASADQVQETLRQRGAAVTVASVYNILAQLADQRIYGRRLSATNKMFFDINNSLHIHLYDRENHTYRDLMDDELQNLVNAHLKRRKFKGYTVEDIDIQLIARPTTRKTKTQ